MRVEIRVFGSEEGPILAAAIELVSPSNKDWKESSEAFSSKCINLVSGGAGVLVIDLVTSRKRSLSEEIKRSLGAPGSPTKGDFIYTSSMRPVIKKEGSQIEIWEEALAVGRNLPDMPLWLSGHWPIIVDLEGTYQRTLDEQRFPVAS